MPQSLPGMKVRAGELRSVLLMIAHSFFMGAATVFFETAASALFLARFDASFLPFVYLAAAAVGITAGAGYGELKKRVDFAPLMVGTLVFLAGLTVAFRIGLALSETALLIFGLLVAYRLVSILTDLEYWSLAARLYDVRQSKRLYGLVGSGEVVARILGALSIPVLIGFVAVRDLFWFSGASLAACLALLLIIVRTFPRVQRSDRAAEQQASAARQSREKRRPRFDNPYLRSIYVLALAGVLGKYFVDFAFLTQIQTRHDDVAQLAAFFALFGGITQIINLVVRVFVSGRLLTRFGLKVGLLVLPAAHLVCTLALLGAQSYGNLALAFWLVIANQGLYKTLKHPIDHPSFKILYQPLARLKRLGAQITVEVVITPIAIGIAALTMLLLADADPSSIVVLMLANFLLWSIAAVDAFRRYGEALFHALRKRTLDGTSLNLADSKSLSIVSGYLESEDPGDVLFAVDLLERARDPSLTDELVKLLDHRTPDVRRHTLLKIEQLRLHETVDAVAERLEREEDAAVKAAAIRAYCAIERRDSIQIAIAHTRSDEPAILKGALIGLLRRSQGEGRDHARNLVREMAASSDPAMRRLACQVLEEEPLDPELVQGLIDDDDLRVARAALRAASATGSRECLRSVIQRLELRSLRQQAFEALLPRGRDSVSLLAETLESRELSLAARRRVVRLCGRLRGAGTEEGLWRGYASSEQSLRTEILEALEKLGYRSDDGMQSVIRRHVDRELRDGHWKMSILRALEPEGPMVPFADALREEIEHNRNRVLYLMAFADNEESLLAAKRHLDAAKASEKRAYAKEMLEVRLDPAVRQRLWPILRPDKVSLAEGASRAQFENNLEELLTRTWESVSVWTRACGLYALRKRSLNRLRPRVEELSQHSNPLLAQTARSILNPSDFDRENDEMLTIEKVLLLKRVDMFAETSEDILTEVADILEEVTLDPGDPIIRKGELGDSMYIVVSGRVRVFDGEKTINELGPREIFGELALLDPEPRSASVDAIDETRLFRLDRETFFELLEDNVGVVSGVMKTLCRRLRKMTVRAMSAPAARAS